VLVRAGLRARQDIGAWANRVAPDGHSARDGAFQPQERTNQREVRTPGLRQSGQALQPAFWEKAATLFAAGRDAMVSPKFLPGWRARRTLPTGR